MDPFQWLKSSLLFNGNKTLTFHSAATNINQKNKKKKWGFTHLIMLLSCHVVCIPYGPSNVYSVRLDGVENNLPITLAETERILAGRQPVGFLWGPNHTHPHTHTHLQGSSLLPHSLSCKTETDFPEKSTSHKVKGADQQTCIANRGLSLLAFMFFPLVEWDQSCLLCSTEDRFYCTQLIWVVSLKIHPIT